MPFATDEAAHSRLDQQAAPVEPAPIGDGATDAASPQHLDVAAADVAELPLVLAPAQEAADSALDVLGRANLESQLPLPVVDVHKLRVANPEKRRAGREEREEGRGDKREEREEREKKEGGVNEAALLRFLRAPHLFFFPSFSQRPR